VGTEPTYDVDRLEDYLSEIVVSRLNDHLGENLGTLIDLPSRYAELCDGLAARLAADLSQYGIGLRDLYLNAITPPADVQQAIDDRSRLGVLGDDLPDLMKMKTAMALEKAAASGGAAEGGIGMGLGLMVPGLLAGMHGGAPAGATAGTPDQSEPCPECGLPAAPGARFCPHCGHQMLVLRKCAKCAKNLSPKARFCPACGTPAGNSAAARACPSCSSENRPESVFCNQCGEKL
jgi:membrane protease subunit (stomatin/prohibitin family)